MRHPAWIGVPIALLAMGCKEKPAVKPTVPPPAASASSEPVEEPRREVAADTEVEELKAHHKCPNKASKAACDLFEGFAKGTDWNLTTIQSSEARYFGKALFYANGEAEERWVFLVVKKIPLNEARKGDLPLKVAFREIEDTNVAVNSHAEKLFRLVQRDDAVSKRNQTANYVLEYPPSNWDSAAATQGKSTLLHIDSGAYVRQGPGRSLQFVKRESGKPGANMTDGVFVRLYPLSW